jgi:hypothetical protein
VCKVTTGSLRSHIEFGNRFKSKSRLDSIMVGELLVGLIAIAIGIGAGLGPIWYILHGEKKAIKDIQHHINTKLDEVRSEVVTTNERLQQIVMSGIDEKIAVFTTYIDYIQTWSNKQTIIGPTYRNYIDRIKSDIRSLAKYAASMNESQKVDVRGILRKIINALEVKNHHDEAGELNDLSILLSSNP